MDPPDIRCPYCHQPLSSEQECGNELCIALREATKRQAFQSDAGRRPRFQSDATRRGTPPRDRLAVTPPSPPETEQPPKEEPDENT